MSVLIVCSAAWVSHLLLRILFFYRWQAQLLFFFFFFINNYFFCFPFFFFVVFRLAKETTRVSIKNTLTKSIYIAIYIERAFVCVGVWGVDLYKRYNRYIRYMLRASYELGHWILQTLLC